MINLDWKLNVEDFGRIKRASIKLSPFVVMVGRNNTGKSYLASLLWGVLNPDQSILPKNLENSGAFERYKAFFAELVSRERVRVHGDDWNIIADLINESLADQTAQFAAGILACPDAKIGKAAVEFSGFDGAVDIILPKLVEKTDARRTPLLRIRVKENQVEFLGGMTSARQPAVAHRLAMMLCNYLVTGKLRGNALYIPAARTGLMLAYKVLVAGLWGSLEFEDESSSRAVLPRPIVNFLRDLGSFEQDPDQPFYHIATEIERDVLEGGVEMYDGEFNDFWYTPRGSDVRLPIHAVSSLVTELAPFIILLKSGNLPSTIIFEEPEAHLHLSAQRVLAKALVRLVNAGKRIIITTHSDTFIQQINMLMHIYLHPEKEDLKRQFGYTDDELLNPDFATGYLFDPGHDGTVVKEITKTREGFIEPTMNEVIGNLTREIIQIQQTDYQAEGTENDSNF